MSSLAVDRRGLEDLELWLAGLFTAAELAAADLLLQLSVAGGIKAMSASSCCDLAEEDKEEAEQVGVVEDTAPSTELLGRRPVEEPAVSTELDRRARKRYRLLSHLYAAPAANKRRRHRHGGYDGSSSVGGGDEVRGGDYWSS